MEWCIPLCHPYILLPRDCTNGQEIREQLGFQIGLEYFPIVDQVFHEELGLVFDVSLVNQRVVGSSGFTQVIMAMGLPSSAIALRILPMVDDNHIPVMYLSLFITGLSSHLLFELFRVNSWYCSHGAACSIK